jgi:hypothetical protein
MTELLKNEVKREGYMKPLTIAYSLYEETELLAWSKDVTPQGDPGNNPGGGGNEGGDYGDELDSKMFGGSSGIFDDSFDSGF